MFDVKYKTRFGKQNDESANNVDEDGIELMPNGASCCENNILILENHRVFNSIFFGEFELVYRLVLQQESYRICCGEPGVAKSPGQSAAKLPSERASKHSWNDFWAHFVAEAYLKKISIDCDRDGQQALENLMLEWFSDRGLEEPAVSQIRSKAQAIMKALRGVGDHE